MKTFDLKSALLGAILALAVAFSLGAASSNRTAWDYKVVAANAFQLELEKAINANAAEGWEFVSVSGPNNEMWGIAVLRREKK